MIVAEVARFVLAFISSHDMPTEFHMGSPNDHNISVVAGKFTHSFINVYYSIKV